MALLDDVVIGDIVIRGNVVTGLVVGGGALIAWPLIGPVARPLAKSIIKGGVFAYRQAEELFAGAIEGIGDVVAEAQQELGTTTSARRQADKSSSRAT